MEPPMFLTAQEVEILTGYSQPARQANYLRKQGIPHEINRLRMPIVLRSAVESRLTPKSHPRHTSPDFSAVRNGSKTQK